jgi:hypothetical protein
MQENKENNLGLKKPWVEDFQSFPDSIARAWMEILDREE